MESGDISSNTQKYRTSEQQMDFEYGRMFIYANLYENFLRSFKIVSYDRIHLSKMCSHNLKFSIEIS